MPNDRPAQRLAAAGLGLTCAVVLPLLPAAADGGLLAAAPAPLPAAAPAADESPPLAMPPLPACRGWYQYLGEQPFACGLSAGAGLVVLLANGRLTAFAGDSGDRLWSRRCATSGYWGARETWFTEKPLVTDAAVIYQDGAAARAVAAADGQDLWVLGDALPVALGPDSVWVLRRGAEADHPAAGEVFNRVQLVDQLTGAVITDIHTGWLLGWGGAVSGASEQLAVKVVGDVLLLGRDGSRRSFGCNSELNEAELALTPYGLVTLEYAGHARGILEDERGLPHDYSFISPAALYDLGDGHLIWRIDDIDCIDLEYDYRALFSDAMLLALKSGGFIAVELETGKVLKTAEANPGLFRPCIRLVNGRYVYWDSNDEDEHPTGFNRVDPYTGASVELVDNRAMELPDAVICDGMLYLLAVTGASAEQYWEAEGYWGTYGHLLALRLDADGLPLPGQLDVRERPLETAQLYARFVASDDPLADQDLLAEVYAGGVNVLLTALGHLPELSASQLRVLGYWAQALDARYLEYRERAEASEDLLAALYEAPHTVSKATLLDWLGDDTLASLHPQLRGVLAKSGGADAVAYLREYYAPCLGAAPGRGHRVPVPPYAVEPQVAYYLDIGTQAHNLTDWSEACGADGTRYVAYTASGLMCERDIYLAVDADNDGLYEEVLPTGLTDVHQGYSYPGGAHDYGTPSEFKLVLADGQLAVMHHEPILKTADDGWVYSNEAEYVTSPLALADLRRDGDGDGLSDIAESLLLTDPANPDTDGDGLTDQLDPTPNVDPVEMGRLERGIARGLAYFFSDEWTADYYTRWLDADQSGHPWSALYLDIDEAGPVAFDGGPDVYCISLTDDTQRQAFDDHVKTFPGFTRIELRCAKGQEPGTFGMSISLTWVGFGVSLVDLDGELYPVEAYLSWIT